MYCTKLQKNHRFFWYKTQVVKKDCLAHNQRETVKWRHTANALLIEEWIKATPITEVRVIRERLSGAQDMTLWLIRPAFQQFWAPEPAVYIDHEPPERR